MDWKSKLQSYLPIELAVEFLTPRLAYIKKQWVKLTPATRALPLHIWRAIINFKNHGLRQAAALSYYAVFSVFPLTLLLAVAISSILGPTVAEQQIVDAARLFLPEEEQTIELIQDSVAQSLEQGSSFGLIALVGLIWSALGLFSNLTTALDIIFQVPSSRSMWRQRMLAFFMTFILIFLVAISFVTSGILRLIDALLLTNPSVWITIGTFFLPLGLNMVIFVLLFRYVPSRYVHWDAVWPAAILGAIGLKLLETLFIWYLTNFGNYQIVYGSIGVAIVLLLWAFLTASVFLLSAELCSQLNLWLISQEESQRLQVFRGNNFLQLPAEIPPPI